MACTSKLLPFGVPHHAWRTEVTSTTYVPDELTNMWGRRVFGEHVVLHKHDVCERCGATRHEEDCICDVAVGDA